METIDQDDSFIGLASTDATMNAMVEQLAALDLNETGDGEAKDLPTAIISLKVLMIPLWRT